MMKIIIQGKEADIRRKNNIERYKIMILKKKKFIIKYINIYIISIFN